MTSERSEQYLSLHRQHLRDEAVRVHSAERVLQTLFARFMPASVLDVGCGIGLWLAVAERLGAKELCGVEGPWIEDAPLRIARSNVVVHDLEQGLTFAGGLTSSSQSKSPNTLHRRPPINSSKA
jgi:2-polyprenyl-3-methyl-5-hydroxy-6-metoxy-1,4-benzoquinol methylase